MSFLRWLPGRSRARVVPTSTCRVEALEGRQLLSAGPVLTGVTLAGPVSAVNAVVLSFNEPLDPTGAQNLQAYAFGKVGPQNSDNGFSLGDLLPFSTTAASRSNAVGASTKSRPRLVKAGKIQFASAVYDNAARTVTLTPLAPFRAQAFFRVLRVKGTGANALHDASGNVLNGGVDQVLNWSMRQGKQVMYLDAAHNRVTLRLRGRGRLFVFLRRRADADPVIFLDSTNAGSTLSGTVKNHGQTGGLTPIAEIDGDPSLAASLQRNPSFQVQSVIPAGELSPPALGRLPLAGTGVTR